MMRFLVSCCFVAVLTIVGAAAWDTKESSSKGPGERHKWLSIYTCFSGGGGEACRRNEHEQLANRALNLATNRHEWSIGERTDFRAVDLNASLFRPRLDELNAQPETSSNGMPLEERHLPPPPHFAGIPDFSYTIYDWINKNELCPARPANDPQLDYCHVYALWHGAAFNASHFGSQASRSYVHLHGTAMALANDAAGMMNAAKSDPERDAHRLAIREAELLALAYEAYAQHFLSDRWAVGHMFDRWGAPEYNAGAYGNDLGTAAATGIFTGILHGYESVAGENIPDGLSSPEYLSNGIFSTPSLYSAQWRFSSGTNTYDGVGDYRLDDMDDGSFGKEYAVRGYSDYPLSVTTQERWMMRCLSASFGEVIRAFGRHPDGGFGIDNVSLTDAGQRSIDGECLDPWATNFAMKVGWGVEGTLLSSTNAAALARYAPLAKTDVDADDLSGGSIFSAGWFGALDRISLVKTSAKIAWRAYWDPEGVDLAQGGIGSYGAAQTANNYAVASYLEPASIAGLPDSDPRGRDKESIYGLFNRAGAGYFCERSEELLQDYRRGKSDKHRAVCRLLAHRMYASTRQGYEGPQKETQSVDFNNNRTKVRPLCEVAPGSWQPPSSQTDDATPYHLHPGYVPWGAIYNQTRAFEADEWQLSTKSIAAWCDAVPVIDALDEEEDRNRDIVARVEDPKEEVTLNGLNFGRQKGVILIGSSRESSIALEENNIRSWRDNRITLRLEDQFDEISFDGERQTFLFIDRVIENGDIDPGAASVGRFVLLDDIPRPQVKSVRVSRRNKMYLEYAAPVEEAEDPGAFAEDLPVEDAPRPFRPIDPGTVTVEIEFDRNMDREAEETVFRVGSDRLTGEWTNDKRWRGTLEVLGGDFFHRRVGFQTISINAKADAGGWIDADATQFGDQPYEELQVLVDTIPVIVEEVEVRAGNKRIYKAEWIGGPDLDEETNLTIPVLNDPQRSLNVSVKESPPADGEGQIRLELSGAAVEPPTLTVGGTAVELQGAEESWRGTFDFAAATEGIQDGRIPIIISIKDDANKNLDGDPRTVTQINPPGQEGNHWVRYEAGRGSDESSSGGADDWHFLSAPVDLSLVLILDASGSMGDGTGRMENAKDGIAQTLDRLPEDKIIEAGAVVFYGCSDIRTRPFTRDIEVVKSFLLSASPTSATPLANAHHVAGSLFDGSADPASPEWRFSTFTDGEESCGGNVAGAAQALNAKIRDHKGALERQPPAEPEPPKPLEQVECRPESWRAYEVDEEVTEPFNTFRLVELWYLERALPDGRCFARLETRKYGVYYGSGRVASGWGVNSRPSEVTSEFGTSSKGIENLDRVRNLSISKRNYATTLQQARQRISDLVRRELEEN